VGGGGAESLSGARSEFLLSGIRRTLRQVWVCPTWAAPRRNYEAWDVVRDACSVRLVELPNVVRSACLAENWVKSLATSTPDRAVVLYRFRSRAAFPEATAAFTDGSSSTDARKAVAVSADW
jgi:hypothetical protein